MRTTLTVPDEYYTKIKSIFKGAGYTTINDFMLDVLRHALENKVESKLPKPVVAEVRPDSEPPAIAGLPAPAVSVEVPNPSPEVAQPAQDVPPLSEQVAANRAAQTAKPEVPPELAKITDEDTGRVLDPISHRAIRQLRRFSPETTVQIDDQKHRVADLIKAVELGTSVGKRVIEVMQEMNASNA